MTVYVDDMRRPARLTGRPARWSHLLADGPHAHEQARTAHRPGRRHHLMAVTKRTRFEVLKRDNHTCRYCGEHAPDVVLQVDHVIPVTLGGSDDPSNLVAACRDCNAGKASTTPDAPLVTDVSQEAIRWAAALKEVAELRAEADRPRHEYVAAFDKAWHEWHHGKGQMPVPRDGNWRQSVGRFHDLGVPIDELTALITVACGNKRLGNDDVWRYFCGCAWRIVTEIQDAAKALLAKEDTDDGA